ncbi:hypothetical protein GF340_00045 [Candidatus Peregrinibacteria bacterium]|nr:hypothetical protein [Candidatus Peregrinibacteria bacterium]
MDETNEMIRFPEVLLADSKIDVDSEGIVLPKILQIKEGVFFMIRSPFLVGSIKELQVESGAKFIIIGGKLENVDYEKGDQLIPEEAEIDGSIALVSMYVKNLPKRFMIGESIEFAYLKELELPNELIVGKDLMLTDTEISRWPELLVVNRNVYCSKEQRAKIHELMAEEKATLHGKCIIDRYGNL